MKVRELWRGCWRDSPLQLRPAPERLELPLRPSPRLRGAALTSLLALLAYTLQLAVHGHLVAAAVMLLFTGAATWQWRLRSSQDGGSLRQLLCAGDGNLSLVFANHAVEAVSLSPSSLRLGRHLLLVLQGPTRVHRLLLGPDNLAPSELAALNRRLPTATVVPGTALHSLAAHRGRSAGQP
jgi:hypothetical protein